MRDKLTSLCGQIYNLSFKVVSFFIKKMQFLYQKMSFAYTMLSINAYLCRTSINLKNKL
jgi:hypothetical protein